MDGTQETWRSQAEAAARAAEIWRRLVEDSTRAASESLAAGARPIDAIARDAVEYTALATKPMRDLIAGQREFVEQVGRWAEMLREVADSLASWSARQQESLDSLDRLLPPYESRS